MPIYHATRFQIGVSSCRALLSTRLLLMVPIMLIVVACTTLRVGSDYDHNASFAGYHSFAWLPREHVDTHNPLVIQRARDAIQSELTQKGFVYLGDTAAPDFVVDFTIGARERTEIRSYPAPYADAWYWGYPGWWGYPYWGTDVDVRQYHEGTLSIDVFDARTHRPVWHGWAKKELRQSDIEHSEGPIREAVQAVLATFPPK